LRGLAGVSWMGVEMDASVLVCEECGCSSDERAVGWTAFLGEDPDGLEPSCVGVFCPVCAERDFGYTSDATGDHL